MTIYHILLLKFKADITPADIEKVRARLRDIPVQIPAISGVKLGHKIKHHLDRDFDEGFIYLFEDEDKLKSYADDPEHRKLQEDTNPYIQDKLAFDLYVEE